MEPEVSLLQLNDGRKLSYAEYGSPDGIPVFFFHGTPGSHLFPQEDAAVVKRLGIRLILPVRPGFGQSDFQPQRKLLDWANDIVALAQALDISRFGVIGVSGGGPFAIACAYKIPQYLTRVGLLSSPAPCDAFDDAHERQQREYREAEIMNLYHRVRDDLENFLAEGIANAPESERARLEALKPFSRAIMQESFRQGAQGLLHEAELLYEHTWGFALEQVTAKVYLWHSEDDNAVLVRDARYPAEHIPNCTATFFKDVGHGVPKGFSDELFGIFTDAHAEEKAD